ncbi:hypothetical protein Y032_0016g3140 [Ancylostoma ceylanicum]|uniref:Uncharacterized protein n=1 Tax=Ancylostoma ceylanicum TaxID=53326 RepID=A0A016V798_9BILA|nr:hypothetical protein Y032_0016g3140 [Ancylostoma ceylanicum]
MSFVWYAPGGVVWQSAESVVERRVCAPSPRDNRSSSSHSSHLAIRCASQSSSVRLSHPSDNPTLITRIFSFRHRRR